MCMQNVFLNIHRWLHVGRVLYTYWLNTFSLTTCAIAQQPWN